jgi:hypothetical protein
MPVRKPRPVRERLRMTTGSDARTESDEYVTTTEPAEADERMAVTG